MLWVDTPEAAFIFDLIGGQYVARHRILKRRAKEHREFRPLNIGEPIPAGVYILFRGEFVCPKRTIEAKTVSVGNFWFVPLNTAMRLPRSRKGCFSVTERAQPAATPVAPALPAPEVMPPPARKMVAPLAQAPRIRGVSGVERLARMATHLGVILRAASPRTA